VQLLKLTLRLPPTCLAISTLPDTVGPSPPVQVEGMSEIYTPKQDLSVGMNCYYSPGIPDALHVSGGRPVPAQLYGCEPTVTELP
jgi:hypothetical protein